MERKLMQRLIAWKNSQDRRPLIVEGARQVGKTYLIKTFGERHFDNYIRVDFQRAQKEITETLERTLDPREILLVLEGVFNTKIDPEKTLIFFDEVQDSPRALSALKYFYEDAPEYHIVVAGSLLGVFLRSSDKAPFPVGKVDHLRLEPMDFEEFVLASGRGNLIENTFLKPDDDTFDFILRDLLREYMLVGGMPDAVKTWLEHRDFQLLSKVHSRILTDYRQDFSKYTSNTEAHRITQVFDTLPKQFAKGSDKFSYGVVKEGARAREFELAIEWLVNAGIARRVRRINRGDKIPIRAYIEDASFKLYFLDIGLFRQLANIPPKVIFEKDAIFNDYNGFFAEQFVLQNLAPRDLYYWTGRSAEVDFVLQDDNLNGIPRILPIEVKSGKNTKAKSLMSFREHYSSALAVRFSLNRYDFSDGLLDIPLYKIFGFSDFIAKF